MNINFCFEVIKPTERIRINIQPPLDDVNIYQDIDSMCRRPCSPHASIRRVCLVYLLYLHWSMAIVQFIIPLLRFAFHKCNHCARLFRCYFDTGFSPPHRPFKTFWYTEDIEPEDETDVVNVVKAIYKNKTLDSLLIMSNDKQKTI